MPFLYATNINRHFCRLGLQDYKTPSLRILPTAVFPVTSFYSTIILLSLLSFSSTYSFRGSEFDFDFSTS
jgi:hypothetical protein